MQTFLIDRTATPVGELVLIADEQGRLRAIDWTDHEARLMKLLNTHYRADRFTLREQRDPSAQQDSAEDKGDQDGPSQSARLFLFFLPLFNVAGGTGIQQACGDPAVQQSFEIG